MIEGRKKERKGGRGMEGGRVCTANNVRFLPLVSIVATSGNASHEDQTMR